jgi:lipoprotein-anchoring transpeptidase ErfK/SrfK
MRSPLPVCTAALLAALVAGGPACAQGTKPGGGLGGGLIEMLMTGQDPTPRGPSRARRAPADLGAGTVDPSRPARVATLPMATPYAPIEREPDARFDRQQVAYSGPYGAGTVVIDTEAKFLYLVEPGGTALRYGIGVGRPGFLWAGTKAITRKSEWPDWTPPPEMLKRRPDLPRHMEGGEENPLGARAMYLGSSLYRIHGTNEPNTIGTNVSSGCIRLRNEDVIDLYERVRVGTTVVVL